MYDLIIVGAGPSGSTLARLLPKSKKVLLLDKRNLNDCNFKRNKACGGLISPDAQRMLAKFNLGIPKEVLVDPQLFSVKVIDVDNNLERFYQRNYLNIDREKFDCYLNSLLPENVTKMYEVIYNSYQRTDTGYRVFYIKNGKKEEVEGKLIVAADGGNSSIRNSIYPNDKVKKYISIQKWFLQDNPINHYTAIFDKSISDYYQWTISKGKYLIVGSTMDVKDKSLNQKFKKLEKLLTNKGFDLSREVKKESSFIIRPLNQKNIKTGKEGLYLIGEAAGLISPSSAEGYSYAFKSAYYLSKALQEKTVRKSYNKQLRKLRCNLLLKKMKLPAMYNKTIRRIILKTNILTIDIESE